MSLHLDRKRDRFCWNADATLDTVHRTYLHRVCLSIWTTASHADQCTSRSDISEQQKYLLHLHSFQVLLYHAPPFLRSFWLPTALCWHLLLLTAAASVPWQTEPSFPFLKRKNSPGSSSPLWSFLSSLVSFNTCAERRASIWEHGGTHWGGGCFPGMAACSLNACINPSFCSLAGGEFGEYVAVRVASSFWKNTIQKSQILRTYIDSL